MALSPAAAQGAAQDLLKMAGRERLRLDRIRDYIKGDVRFTWLPSGAPREIQALATLARVNILRLVPQSETQSLYVDGYSRQDKDAAAKVWDVWQRNQWDARQLGVYRAASTYGAAYGITLPGEPVPVLRAASPRHLTAAYGDDDVWPEMALEKRRNGQWKLYDKTSVYTLYLGQGGFTWQRTESHGLPVCPVVRYVPTEDLDDPICGSVEPLLALQDQINLTTFLLLVAQHYGAHGQRYIIGWLASAQDRAKASASRFLTIPKKPSEISVGEFDQVDLKPYLDSREATMRHLAVISQTPANELLGQIVQVSAEALDAVNASNDRKLIERETSLGEGHEQLLGLAGTMIGVNEEPLAEMQWRDTAARRLGLVVSALAVLAEKLSVPVEELYSMVPGVSQTTVERWIAARQGDPDAAAEAADQGPQEEAAQGAPAPPALEEAA